MPGVPSGKGCNTCRKAKKKCDQAKPLCSRCKRLNVVCDGAGQQRYLFKDQSSVQAKKQSSSESPDAEKALVVLGNVLYIPSNETSRVVRSFIGLLEVKDVRYNLSFAQGDLLEEIPQRIGSSKALEMTTYAYMKAFETHRNPHRRADVIAHYAKAIEAIRTSLDDPETASSPETLCSIYLLMVVQAWVGSTKDVAVGHGRAISYLLERGCFRSWNMGSFEKQLLSILCCTVAIESYQFPGLRLSPWIMATAFPMFESFSSTGTAIEDWQELLLGWTDEHMTIIGQYVIFVMLRMPDLLHDVFLQPEIRVVYVRIMAITQKIAARMTKVMANITGPNAKNLYTSAASYYRFYGLTLSMALFTNSLLQSPAYNDEVLLTDQDFLLEEVLHLAADSSRFRPLGSSHMSVPLAAALASVQDNIRRGELLKAIGIHMASCTAVYVIDFANRLTEVFQDYQQRAAGTTTGHPLRSLM